MGKFAFSCTDDKFNLLEAMSVDVWLYSIYIGNARNGLDIDYRADEA